MRRKIHLQKKRKIKYKLNLVFLIIIPIIIGIVVFLKFVNKKVTPAVMNQAEIQTTKIATMVINKAVSDEVINQINVDDLFIISENNENDLKTIDFNPITINKTVAMITTNVQKYLKKLENGDVADLDIDYINTSSVSKLKKGIIYEIPSGLVFNNTLLTNIGPKIPVKISLIGDVSTNFKTDITNYGINNALIKLTLAIEVEEQIILPFTSKPVSVKAEVPLALKLMQGTVPNYYVNGSTNLPNVTIEEQ